MAVPTVRGTGTAASAAASPLVVPLSTGFTFAAGDLNVVLIETIGNATLGLPAGWSHFPGSPVNIDTTSQLNVVRRFWVTGDAAPSFTGFTDHAVGRMITFGGVHTTTPHDVTAPQAETVLDTSATWPAVTTTGIERLILLCIATGRDINATTNLGAVTGGTGLTSITERFDNWVNTIGGGGIGLVTAEKLTAGTTGTPGATMASTDAKGLLTIALRPAPATPVTITNTAEGYSTDNTTVTTGNSGGGSGTAFAGVFGTMAARNTAGEAREGSWFYEHGPATATAQYATLTPPGSPTQLALRRYVYLTGYPSAVIEWAKVNNSLGLNFNMATTGIVNLGLTPFTAAGVAVPLNTWVREEFSWDVAGGAMTYKLYAANDSTLLGSITQSGLAMGTGAFTVVSSGKASAAGNLALFRQDAIASVSHQVTEVGSVGAPTINAAADRAVTAGLTSAAVRGHGAASELDVTATLTSAALRGHAAVSDLPVTATLTADATVTAGSVSAPMPITAGLTAAGSRGSPAAADLAVTAGLTGAATKGVAAASSLAVTAGLTAASGRNTTGAATTTVTAGLTAAAIRGQSVASSLPVTATLSSAADTAGGVAATSTVTAALTASASAAVSGGAPLTVTAAVSSAATRTAAATGTLTVTAGLTAAATVTHSATASQPVTAGLAGAAARASNVQASLAVTATLTAAASTGVTTQTNVVATLTSTATRQQAGASTLPVTATLSAAAVATKAAAALLPVVATLAGSVSQGQRVTATLTVAATVTAETTIVRPAAASLTITATLTAEAVLVIPPEFGIGTAGRGMIGAAGSGAGHRLVGAGVSGRG